MRRLKFVPPSGGSFAISAGAGRGGRVAAGVCMAGWENIPPSRSGSKVARRMGRRMKRQGGRARRKGEGGKSKVERVLLPPTPCRLPHSFSPFPRLTRGVLFPNVARFRLAGRDGDRGAADGSRWKSGRSSEPHLFFFPELSGAKVILPDGVMAAHEPLELRVQVRILVGQPDVGLRVFR